MHYRVDGSNRIVEVSPGWDTAANAVNAGAGALESALIGRPLESCIAGDATKMFVRAALEAARVLQQTRALPYRCDTPEEHRRFEMVISPLADGHVKVEHRQLSSEPVAARRRAGHDHPKRALAPVGWRCSQCWKVRLGPSADWSEATAEPPFPLAQDVCPQCTSRLFEPATP